MLATFWGAPYLVFLIGHCGQRSKPHGPFVCLSFPLSRICWRMATRLQPARRCGRTWGRSHAAHDPSRPCVGLWFRSINFGYVQYAPQLRRDSTAAYYRCELISLFGRCSGSLFATQLLYALVDGLRLRRRRRGSGGARTLQRRVDVGGFGSRVRGGVLLGHGTERGLLLPRLCASRRKLSGTLYE